jgi:hypothetical protein
MRAVWEWRAIRLICGRIAPELATLRRAWIPWLEAVDSDVRSRLVWVNVALRGLMEFGIVAGFAFWGYHLADNTGIGILFAVGAVLVGFGFWGLVDFHQAGRWAEWLRLAEELVISGLAAAAWWAAGQSALGIAMALISLVYHVLVYTAGERLLSPT